MPVDFKHAETKILERRADVSAPTGPDVQFSLLFSHFNLFILTRITGLDCSGHRSFLHIFASQQHNTQTNLGNSADCFF